MTSAAMTRSRFHATQTTGSTGKADPTSPCLFIQTHTVFVCMCVCVCVCALPGVWPLSSIDFFLHIVPLRHNGAV